MQIQAQKKLDWLQELELRYHRTKPQNIDLNNPADLARLSEIEKSYLFDMIRLIDEVKQFRLRHDDFKYVLDHVPDHELIRKVRSGRLKPEEKIGG